MNQALKTFKIGNKILARRSNALWNILLAAEKDAKKLAARTMTRNSVHLQTEYMGTRMTKVIVEEVPVNVNGDSLVAFLLDTPRLWTSRKQST